MFSIYLNHFLNNGSISVPLRGFFFSFSISLTVLSKYVSALTISNPSAYMVLEKIEHGVRRSTNTPQPNRYLASVHLLKYPINLQRSVAFTDESSDKVQR